jgi:hypothetical protein
MRPGQVHAPQGERFAQVFFGHVISRREVSDGPRQFQQTVVAARIQFEMVKRLAQESFRLGL